MPITYTFQPEAPPPPEPSPFQEVLRTVGDTYNTSLLDQLDQDESGVGGSLIAKFFKGLSQPKASEVDDKGSLSAKGYGKAFLGGAVEGLTKPSTLASIATLGLAGVPAAVIGGADAATDLSQTLRDDLSPGQKALHGFSAVAGGAGATASKMLGKADVSPASLLYKRAAGELEEGPGGVKGFFSSPKVKGAAAPIIEPKPETTPGASSITPMQANKAVLEKVAVGAELTPDEEALIIKNLKGGGGKFKTDLDHAISVRKTIEQVKKPAVQEAKAQEADEKELRKFAEAARKKFESGAKEEASSLNAKEKYGAARAKEIDAQIEADAARTGVEDVGSVEGLEEIKRTITKKYTNPIEGGTETGTIVLGKPKGEAPPKGKPGSTGPDDNSGDFNPTSQTPTTSASPTNLHTAPNPPAGKRVFLPDTPANRLKLIAKAKSENMNVVRHEDGTLELVPLTPTKSTVPASPPSTLSGPSKPFPTHIEARGFQKKAGGTIQEVIIDGKKRYQVVPDDGGVTPKHPELPGNAAHQAEVENPVPNRRGADRVATSAEDTKYEIARQAIIDKNKAAQASKNAGTEVPPIVPAKPKSVEPEVTDPTIPGKGGSVEPPKETTVYKGYLIKKNPLNDAWWVEKDGVKISYVKDYEDGVKAVDEVVGVSSPPTTPPLPKDSDFVTDTMPGGPIPLFRANRSKAEILGEHQKKLDAEANVIGTPIPREFKNNPTSGLGPAPVRQGARIAGMGARREAKGSKPAPQPQSEAYPGISEQTGKIDDLLNLQRNQPKRDPERGAVEIMKLLRGTGGLAGAAYGGATGEDTQDRLVRAAGFGALGAMSPDIARNIPDTYRAMLLTKWPNLGINSVLAPWGSGVISSAEHALANRPGIKALADKIMPEGGTDALPSISPGIEDYDWANESLKKTANPINFLKGLPSAWRQSEELAREAMERGEISESLAEAPSYFRRLVEAAGRAMTSGDLSIKNVMDSAMAPEEVGRAATLTNEPDFPALRNLVNLKRGLKSPVLDTAIPFVRTIANQTESNIERTPLLGILAQYRFKHQTSGPDPKNLILAQQILGTGVPMTTFMLGYNTPVDIAGTPMVSKVLSNVGGQYGQLAVMGYLMGQGMQRGMPLNEAARYAAMEWKNFIPLPTADPLTDVINAATRGQLPRSVTNSLPAKLYRDGLTGPEEPEVPPPSFRFQP